jgi:hypothetical protein
VGLGSVGSQVDAVVHSTACLNETERWLGWLAMSGLGAQPRGHCSIPGLTLLLGFISKKIPDTVYPERSMFRFTACI